MLTRSSQVGEFYVMSPPQVKPENPQFTCDMMIYDEESDRHVRIQWKDAMDACLIGVNGGVDGTKEVVGVGQASVWQDHANAWATYNASSDANAAYPPALPGGGNADINLRIVVARPFIECATPFSPPRASRLWLTTALCCVRAGTSCTTPSSRSRGATRAPRFSARRTCSFQLTLRSRRSRVRAAPACTRTRTPPCTTR